MSNFQKMLKQAQKMQRDMERKQSELAKTEYPFASNGVTVVARGDFTLISITLAPELLQNPDQAMLQDLLLVAANGALTKAREDMEAKLSSITGGMNLPGMG
jgi:DNA-binding YbaB/EbfC family protein